MNLKNLTTEELLEEIKRREEQKKSRPQPLSNPNFAALVDFVKSGIENPDDGGVLDEDFEHYVYEEVMNAVYGKDIWKWIDSQR